MDIKFIRRYLSEDGEITAGQLIPEGYFKPPIDSITFLVPILAIPTIGGLHSDGNSIQFINARKYAEYCYKKYAEYCYKANAHIDENHTTFIGRISPYIESDKYFKYLNTVEESASSNDGINWNPENENPTC